MILPLVMLALLAGHGGAAQAQNARTAGAEGAETGRWRGRIHWVPARAAQGEARLLETRICRPIGAAPARAVIVNHGSPWARERRAAMQPQPCEHETIVWFLARGHVVLIPMRRGFGRSDGPFEEGFGPCGRPDFIAAAEAIAHDIAATLAYARTLPFVGALDAVVVGQSAGGWGALALAAGNPVGVAAVVNMAGGGYGGADAVRAGCRTPLIEPAAAVLGARARRVPTLWVYTANDSFFGPALVAGMHEAFSTAGGQAELRQLPPFGTDGHGLFFARGGWAIWGPVLTPFLARHAPFTLAPAP